MGYCVCFTCLLLSLSVDVDDLVAGDCVLVVFGLLFSSWLF